MFSGLYRSLEVDVAEDCPGYGGRDLGRENKIEEVSFVKKKCFLYHYYFMAKETTDGLMLHKTRVVCVAEGKPIPNFSKVESRFC